MPATAAGWTPRTAARWTVELRTRLDDSLGYSLSYDATAEGDWTATVGEAAWTADQGFSIAIQALDPRQATGSALDAAVAPIVERRAASSSRYDVEVQTATNLNAGDLFRDPTTERSWSVVTGGAYVNGDMITIEAVDAGPLALSEAAPTTLTPITALLVPTNLVYDTGGTYQIGRAIESDSQLRRRWSRELGRPRTGTAAGIRRTLLRLVWLDAVSAVRTSAGHISIYVVPAPVGTDQDEALAEAIYRCVGVDVVLGGTESLVIAGVDGQDVTIRWTPGTEQAVDVEVTVTLATGVSLEDVEDACLAAVQEVLDALEVGQALRRLAILQALPGPDAGVTGAVVLLDGLAADVVPPTSTTLLVEGVLEVVT